LLAFCTAVSVNTVSSRENMSSDDMAALMNALNLEMTDWWKPYAGELSFSGIERPGY
jgi:ParB family chromosome partitioning protein